MAVALATACVLEFLSGNIFRWLSVVTLAYVLGARLSLGASVFGLSLLSLLLAFAVVVLFGWRRGYLGGGLAKLAVAVCAGLPPGMAACVAGGLVLCGRALESTRRWHGVRRVPGSVVLAALVGLTVGAAVGFGQETPWTRSWLGGPPRGWADYFHGKQLTPGPSA
jgi:hypothetical protein